MRLAVSQLPSNKHTELVSAVGWNNTNELYSYGDDKAVWKWSMEGEPLQSLKEDFDAFATDMHWMPTLSRTKTSSSNTEIFALACTDGTLRLVNKAANVTKKVDAHKGAVISVRWNYDGSGLVTGGEDGLVKEWSQACMLRSTLAQTEHSIYSVCWSPDGDKVLFASGNEIYIKPLQPTQKQFQRKAHDGVVLKVDWNPVNNLIVSCGEDCRYKVWDAFGALVFVSQPEDTVINSVAWSPDGEMFAVGSFNTLQLCDKTGWSYSRETMQSGSMMNLSWTSDGTHLAGAGGDGAVVFANVADRRIEWDNLVCHLSSNKQISVLDVVSENVEEFDFRDRVIKLSMGFDYIVAATTTQLCVCSIKQWGTPQTFDIKDTVTLLLQAEKHFLVVDNGQGMSVFSYEGRPLSHPKFQGLRTEFLNSQSVAVSNAFVAAIQKPDLKTIRVFDATTGKALDRPIKHTLDVHQIGLSQHSKAVEMKLVLLDRNRDMYVASIMRPNALVKLGSMVDHCMFHDKTDMLAAVQDGNLSVWYYPDVVFVDKDLIPKTRVVKAGSEFGRSPKIVNFHGDRCCVRRTNGAMHVYAIDPFPSLLYQYASAAQWNLAVRLCRFVKDEALWSVVAAMAVQSLELDTAEVAYAAIEEVDKVQYVLHIKGIPSPEGRTAEVYTFMRRPEEGEAILLQASLLYRAIKLNIKLFRWDRALEIAVSHKTHLDTVLAYRKRYLDSFGLSETNKRFQQYFEQDIELDWEKIKAKIKQDKQREKDANASS
eukprot:Rmarinus@m.26807